MSRFQDILVEYGPALKRVAASYAPPGAEREDLEQEILAAIHHALPGFRGESSVRTYIYRIAHNCGIQALKSRERSAETSPLREQDHVTSKTPESRALERERYERLASAIRELPLSLRQPMVLRLEGLSYEEVGAILGLTQSAVGVRLHRATTALERLMEERR